MRLTCIEKEKAMTASALTVLKSILAKDGGIIERPNQLEGLLYDYFQADQKRDVFLLLLVQRTGIVQKLKKTALTKQKEALYIEMLYNRYGLDKELAAWAIATWAEALCNETVLENNEVIIFADSQLEEAVRLALHKEKGTPITKKEGESLTVLRADNRRIQDLTGIEQLKSLVHLSLENNIIETFAPLGQLDKLSTLFMAKNQVQIVSSICLFPSIRAIDFSYNPINDLAVCSDKTLLLLYYSIGEDWHLRQKVEQQLKMRNIAFNELSFY